MTACTLCFVREGEVPHLSEPGWLCCLRAHDRMLAALRDIPVLVDELAGLGYVERDTRPGTRAVREGRLIVRVPAMADPVAYAMTAGPVPGATSGPRVAGSALPSVPIRIDPVDLLGPVNHAARGLLARGALGLDDDQIGHLSVATMLDGWVRDWATYRGEGLPHPSVRSLSGWLLDRLDWACEHHPALDEFAQDLHEYRHTLTALCGRRDALPTPVDRPCPACGVLALQRPPGDDLIVCGHCDRALTDEDYRNHLEDVIKTNWTVVDPDDPRTRPVPTTPVWVRDDELGGVVLGSIWNGTWRSAGGSELTAVSYWAPISYPADPGPAKDDTA